MLPTEIKISGTGNISKVVRREIKRPCLVLALLTPLEDGMPIVRVLPITHTPPARSDEPIRFPQAIERCHGLDGERSRIVLSESSRFA
ncbi:hypothetical protein NXT3_PB00004 (plasmid) [Sinorhizobium fredii]|uniref:Uncharacterized protein n=1 Tax=Rhizobium fredii TaxID=380 RepID=A0A2L0HAY6_RHIFR|nr:hypothetical protein NXT3_PB00004 [Sinorhizobium fredii]